ncbi:MULTISPECIES: carbohydrate ABC transporter permease [Aestuariimicrobium]|uniref:carbohydrate ABC transporter permease n=1 Tax=Aestuariimicrobium TaxID=396388 RepID=UPI000685AB42|nr:MULTISPECIES: sugar ABC transporter permease [Aestuariimicrobium]CAI9400846.1 Lactose transport system permease protein LacF [Aestuariimicrobium sp. T2.26MG-19.2B]
MFMSPAIIGLLLFSLGPMVASLVLSFTQYDMLSSPTWVGGDNYATLVRDPLFLKSLRVSLTYSVISVPITMVVALLLAMLLNSKLPVMGFFRSAYYLPSVISGVAVAMVWRWMYNGEYGLINVVLGWLGIDGPAWLTDERWALRSLIFMSVWGFGGTMLIYLAGLQSLPTDLYEAARVDGASTLRQQWYITLPMLSNVTFFNLVMGIIGSLQVFAEPFVLTNGGPNNSTMLLPLYLYQNAFTYLKMGYAAAIAWVAFALVMVLTLLVFKSTPVWVHTEAGEN